MSLRNKEHKKQLSISEIENLKKQNDLQARADNLGLTPEQVARVGNVEEKVFFAKGDNNGMEIKGGETELVKLSELDPRIGTQTYIKFKDKNRQTKEASTIITKDKKLVDTSGKVIRELY